MYALFSSFNSTTNTTMSTIRTYVQVQPTDLRMNDEYIFYYNNLAKLVVTGIVPFAALCIFNFKVFLKVIYNLTGTSP
jgi:hypothetical protein